MPGRGCNPETGFSMRVLFLIVFCSTLFGCGALPRIVTENVKVAVPTPCNPDLGPRPDLMTKEQIREAIDETPTLDDRVKIVTEQLLHYIGWLPVVEAALSGCKGH